MPRHAIFQLVSLFEAGLVRETQRSVPLSPEIQVMVTLRFLAKGSFQSELADMHGNVQSSVSTAIKNTIHQLCHVLDLIKFPKDRSSLKEKFHRKFGFLNMLGCIDCTLVAIKRPPANEEVAYVCRKGYHTINIQAICDPDMRFLNIVCKWPGSTHDSFIFANSWIGAHLEAHKDDGWLLGDSGYPCRPWLLTPLAQPQTCAEKRYNSSHCRTLNTIERAFGLLKSRFRCIHKSTGCLWYSVKQCHRNVNAAAQLHNFCIDLRLPTPPADEDDTDDRDDNVPAPCHAQDGYLVRRQLIENVFAKNTCGCKLSSKTIYHTLLPYA